MRAISTLQYLRSTPSSFRYTLWYYHPHKLRTKLTQLKCPAELHAQSARLITFSTASTTSQLSLGAVFRHKQVRRKYHLRFTHTLICICCSRISYIISKDLVTKNITIVIIYINYCQQDATKPPRCFYFQDKQTPKATVYHYYIPTYSSVRSLRWNYANLHSRHPRRAVVLVGVPSHSNYGDQFSLGHAVAAVAVVHCSTVPSTIQYYPVLIAIVGVGVCIFLGVSLHPAAVFGPPSLSTHLPPPHLSSSIPPYSKLNHHIPHRQGPLWDFFEIWGGGFLLLSSLPSPILLLSACVSSLLRVPS